MQKNLIAEIVGWAGTAMIVLAYFLNSFLIIQSNSFWYHILNIAGGVGIMIISYTKKAYQPMVLNIIWTAIALIVLIRTGFGS
ncbi:MAG: CBU_0592 family membrane protein [Candidatus Altimarinota bacterium]